MLSIVFQSILALKKFCNGIRDNEGLDGEG